MSTDTQLHYGPNNENDEASTMERLFLWVKDAEAPALASDGILYPRFVTQTAKGKLILASVPNSILSKIQRRELPNVLDVDLRAIMLN